MPAAVGPGELEQLLEEQTAYYRAVATEYVDHGLPFAGSSVWIETADEILREPTVTPIRIIEGSDYFAGRIGVGYFGVVIDPGRSRVVV